MNDYKESQWDLASIIHLEAEIDMSNAMLLREQLVQLVETAPTLIVDCDGLDFIDSSGLAVLVSTLNECKQQGKRLVISGLQNSPAMAFKLTRLDQLFEIVKSPFSISSP